MEDYEDYKMTDVHINGVDLKMTCGACPEQYDCYLDGKQIGYLSLRHGYFYADYPDCGGERIYDAHPDGDGVFSGYERESYLTEAVNALLREHKKHQTDRDVIKMYHPNLDNAIIEVTESKRAEAIAYGFVDA